MAELRPTEIKLSWLLLIFCDSWIMTTTGLPNNPRH